LGEPTLPNAVICYFKLGKLDSGHYAQKSPETSTESVPLIADVKKKLECPAVTLYFVIALTNTHVCKLQIIAKRLLESKISIPHSYLESGGKSYRACIGSTL
jgi:hypothetical protein